jgi:hypothetical protein
MCDSPSHCCLLLLLQPHSSALNDNYTFTQRYMLYYSASIHRLSPINLTANWRRLALALVLGGVSVAQAQKPFACTAGKSYLFQGDATTVVEIDLSTGTSKTASTPIISGTTNQKLNAFGYNQVDNYIWGQRTGTSQVVRVNNDYTSTIYDVAGLTGDVTNTVVGDVSPQGIMYLTRGGSPGGATNAEKATLDIYAIDLTKSPLTATTLPVTPPATYLTDWAVSPVDGNLYTIFSTITPTSPSGLTLYRYLTTGTTAGTRETLGTVVAGSTTRTDGTDHPITPSNFGAAFMDSQGNFFIVANETGYIYRIDAPHTAGNLTARYIAAGPPKAANTDGARCPATAVAPLPVQLTAFSATAAPSRRVQLAWTTASEQNSSFFEVQHSLDGRTFAVVGKVAARQNTLVATNYTFLHAAPGAEGTHYYRLRQVDLDGTSTFSPVQVVTLAAGSSLVQLAAVPNPTTANNLHLSVQYQGLAAVPAVLTVHSLLGQTLLTQAVTLQPGTTTLSPTAPLAPGAYWLSLSGEALPGTLGTRVLLTN